MGIKRSCRGESSFAPLPTTVYTVAKKDEDDGGISMMMQTKKKVKTIFSNNLVAIFTHHMCNKAESLAFKLQSL
jgi:hypothetical protein